MSDKFYNKVSWVGIQAYYAVRFLIELPIVFAGIAWTNIKEKVKKK